MLAAAAGVGRTRTTRELAEGAWACAWERPPAAICVLDVMAPAFNYRYGALRAASARLGGLLAAGRTNRRPI